MRRLRLAPCSGFASSRPQPMGVQGTERSPPHPSVRSRATTSSTAGLDGTGNRSGSTHATSATSTPSATATPVSMPATKHDTVSRHPFRVEKYEPIALHGAHFDAHLLAHLPPDGRLGRFATPDSPTGKRPMPVAVGVADHQPAAFVDDHALHAGGARPDDEPVDPAHVPRRAGRRSAQRTHRAESLPSSAEGCDRRLHRPHADLPVRHVGDRRHVGRDEQAVAEGGKVGGGRRFRLPHVGGVAAEASPGEGVDQRAWSTRAPRAC